MLSQVEMALHEAKVECTRYEIDLRNKPEWFVTKINPVGQVCRVHLCIARHLYSAHERRSLPLHTEVP